MPKVNSVPSRASNCDGTIPAPPKIPLRNAFTSCMVDPVWSQLHEAPAPLQPVCCFAILLLYVRRGFPRLR
eukprot:6490363-Amphidinium_carterae.3